MTVTLHGSTVDTVKIVNVGIQTALMRANIPGNFLRLALRYLQSLVCCYATITREPFLSSSSFLMGSEAVAPHPLQLRVLKQKIEIDRFFTKTFVSRIEQREIKYSCCNYEVKTLHGCGVYMATNDL